MQRYLYAPRTRIILRAEDVFGSELHAPCGFMPGTTQISLTIEKALISKTLLAAFGLDRRDITPEVALIAQVEKTLRDYEDLLQRIEHEEKRYA